MNDPKTIRAGESGAIIFYILIAVVLLAALTYAVSQGGRVGSDTLSEDQSRLAANEILSYGSELAAAVQKLKLRDVADTDVSFENPLYAVYTNGNCSTSDCKIFDLDGGGLSYTQPAAIWLDSAFSANAAYGEYVFDGTACVDDLESGNYTTCLSDALDNEELIAFLPFLKQAICLEINDRLSITNPGGDAPVDASCSWSTSFTGAYADGNAVGDATGHLQSRPAGCFKQDAACAGLSNSYVFYQTLLIR